MAIALTKVLCTGTGVYDSYVAWVPLSEKMNFQITFTDVRNTRNELVRGQTARNVVKLFLTQRVASILD